jgi:hypothetical protein
MTGEITDVNSKDIPTSVRVVLAIICFCISHTAAYHMCFSSQPSGVVGVRLLRAHHPNSCNTYD